MYNIYSTQTYTYDQQERKNCLINSLFLVRSTYTYTGIKRSFQLIITLLLLYVFSISYFTCVFNKNNKKSKKMALHGNTNCLHRAVL